MSHKRLALRNANWLFATALMLCMTLFAKADNTFSSSDNNLSFSYPRRWKADMSGDKVQLTPSDGSHYSLQIDTIETYKGESPSTDPELKLKIGKLVQTLIQKPEFVSGSSLTMDHGSGAVFRYRPASLPDAPATSFYVAFVGKHSVFAIPEKSGQSSQAIGMSSIFQSLSFADSLPKAPLARNPRAAMPISKTPLNLPKVGTISYVSQIAPIMKESCEVCHNSKSPLGGLSVSRFADTLKGGRHVDDITPGRPETSLILDYLAGKRTLMPKGGSPLSNDKIALIRKWIAEGARETPDSPAPNMSEPDRTAPPETPANPFNLVNRKKKKKANAPNGSAGVSEEAPVSNPLSQQGKRKLSPNSDVAAVFTLEGYSGHLVSSDISFLIQFRNNKTARAVWQASPGKELAYIGNYSGEDGNYLVDLTLTGVQDASSPKSIKISMRARGGSEDAFFGLNGNPPARSFASLSLSETRELTPGGSNKRTPQRKKGNRTKF